MEFKEWLVIKKKYGNRSAQDVVSRINRIKKILNTKSIDNKTEERLNKSEDFLKITCSVKSQMRVAIRIYLEYKGEKND